MAQTKLKFIPRVDFDTTGIVAGWNVLDVDGLPAACNNLNIINASNTDVNISFDGVTTHEFLAHGANWVYFPQMSAQPPAWECLIAKGTKIYVSAAAPGVGNIYVAGYYV